MLALCSDSLIAFKTGILMQLGFGVMSFMQIYFVDGRPFWDNIKIKSDGLCEFSFGSPNLSTFVWTFFYGYLLVMYRFKYAAP